MQARTIPLKAVTAAGRTDAWWLAPLATAIAMVAFAAYTLWAAAQGSNYYVAPYLSPLHFPRYVPDWWSASPAWLVIWIPSGMRGTCCYQRKAYYRSFFSSPPAYVLPVMHSDYHGES